MVLLFHKTIKDVLSRNIPHEQSLEMTKIHLRLPATPSSQFKKKNDICI